MDFLIKFFSFVQWLIEIVEYLGFTNPIEPDQEPLPIATQTVDVAQQTEDMSETQKPDDCEEKLNDEIRNLQEELQEAYEENKREADRAAFRLDIMQSHYNQKMANLTMKMSEEITKKDIEVLKIEDECDGRIVDLELCNATLMQRIVELETEEAVPSQSLPPTGIPSGQLDPTLDIIANLQEHLSSLDVATEHSKWTVNYVLEQMRDEITSATFCSPHPNEEEEKLIRDSQILQSEMEAVKLALTDARKEIADMEQQRGLLIASESQMKTTVDEKESLLASKDAELNELRVSLQQASLKSQLTTRDVGCDAEDLHQLAAAEGKDVSCGTNDLPQFVAAQRRDVGCSTEDLLPLPITNTTSSLDHKKSANESVQRQGPKDKQLYSEKLKQNQKGKSEAEAAKQPKPAPKTNTEKVISSTVGESILETVMKAISPSQLPKVTVKTPTCLPAVDIKSPVAVPPSADVMCKEKPVQLNAPWNRSNGTKRFSPTPLKPTDAKPLAAPVNVKAAEAATKPAHGFVIISKEIIQTERTDTLLLSDIPEIHYGRIVGRAGKNVRRMEESYGVGLSMVQSITNKDCHNMIIRGGNLEKRRAAAQEIIGSLPATIECINVDLTKLHTPEFVSLKRECFLKTKLPSSPTDKLTISGQLKDCRTAYGLLVGGTSTPPSAR